MLTVPGTCKDSGNTDSHALLQVLTRPPSQGKIQGGAAVWSHPPSVVAAITTVPS